VTHRTATIAELQRDDGWAPIRKHFEVQSFGVNAWSTREAGGTLIPEHDEVPARHEELYLVTSGRATFTVDGEEVDAPAGTLVYVPDPASKRGAVAKDAPATVVSMGGEPGRAFTPRSWEANSELLPLFEAGEYEQVKQRIHEVLDEYDDRGGLLYNLACAEARLGETDAALEHIREAVQTEERYREYAQTDEDLAPIRDDERFPR
jgi:tetratricopeptide (TPR) repeat protein